jgi:hypothetical protein
MQHSTPASPRPVRVAPIPNSARARPLEPAHATAGDTPKPPLRPARKTAPLFRSFCRSPPVSRDAFFSRPPGRPAPTNALSHRSSRHTPAGPHPQHTWIASALPPVWPPVQLPHTSRPPLARSHCLGPAARVAAGSAATHRPAAPSTLASPHSLPPPHTPCSQRMLIPGRTGNSSPPTYDCLPPPCGHAPVGPLSIAVLARCTPTAWGRAPRLHPPSLTRAWARALSPRLVTPASNRIAPAPAPHPSRPHPSPAAPAHWLAACERPPPLSLIQTPPGPAPACLALIPPLTPLAWLPHREAAPAPPRPPPQAL